MTASRVLGLFAKQPIAGQVKTRLAAVRTPAWAAQVAEAFLLDTLDRLATLPVTRRIVFAPMDASVYFHVLAAGRFTIVPQTEGELGQRLHADFAETLTHADQAVVIGSDSPTLPLAFIEQAFDALTTHDGVIGPAVDGGYYLIGFRRSARSLLSSAFTAIPWSRSDVLLTTVRRLQAQSARLAVLPPWYDVDTLHDWHMLAGHLAAWRAAGLDPQVPRTEALTLSDETP